MSFFSRLNPVPSFTRYTGPYTVGTQDVEIPISDLHSPAPAPDPSITTASFRLFYPCEQESKAIHPYWLPEPQGEYWRAYARFLQASPLVASLLSYVPLLRIISFTTIPAIKDAKLLQPTNKVGRWPVLIFSHGLGGTRNAYSHICGSLASHGLVVAAVDHRDGSAPISFIREQVGSRGKPVDYMKLPHQTSPEVEEKRLMQLKIRCWEMGLVHDSLLRLDEGDKVSNYSATKISEDRLTDFASQLDIHTPGKIAWCGHSFGAATVVQFVKSVFYRGSTLYSPSSSGPISQQITASSPVSLLDLWAMPLVFSSTASLWSKPLPAYSAADGAGSPPLAILSEAFFKWKANFREIVHAVSPRSGVHSTIQPNIFYPVASAHLSQSDFGPLFPWLMKKALQADEPNRTLRLNVRAILETLRRRGISIADTSELDREIKDTVGAAETKDLEPNTQFPLGQDHKILDLEGSVRGWIAVHPSTFDGQALINGNATKEVIKGQLNGHAKKPKDPSEAVIQGAVSN